MKNLLGLICIILCFSEVEGQTYGNEWISYEQKYYSFPIVEDGIYKIDYNSLVNSGVPLASIDTDHFQVFGRERQVPLYISDGGDNTLDNGDYIYFYAQRNDSWLDSTLYDDPSWIGNPKYSLYNDTIQYFLTWNQGGANNRFSIESDVDFDNFNTVPYVIDEVFSFYFNQYNEGLKSSNASSSFFVSGEGWGITRRNLGYVWNFNGIEFDNIYQENDSPEVFYNSVLVGSSNAAIPSGAGGNHHTRQTIGNSNYTLVDSVFSGYKGIFSSVSFPSNIINSDGSSNFKVSIVNDLGLATDYQSINYVSFKYPRKTDYNGESGFNFEAVYNNLESKSRIDINGSNLTNPVAFSFGLIPRKIPVVSHLGGYSLLIPNSPDFSASRVVVDSENNIINVNQLNAVNGDGFFTDFTSIPNIDAALLFVYNDLLKSVVDLYVSHRTSSIGGGYNVIMAEVNELYQQYGGGIPKHINGIRRFAHQIYDVSQQKPVGLFLIGKGIREANVTSSTSIGPGTRANISSYQNSLIPSFGQPSCDACITSNLPGTNKYTPLIPTGRISARTPNELEIYLNKIIEYDNQQNQEDVYSTNTKDWQKQILHFSGGTEAAEQVLLQNFLNGMAETAEGDYFAGKVDLVAKENGNPINPNELDEIKNRISEGVSLMNFFGHFTTSSSGFDINLDEPSTWDNQGKYPVLIANSCYNGNIFHNSFSNSESFVLTPNAGVIAYLGTLNYGFISPLRSYSDQFYKEFSQTNYGGTIGSHIKNTIQSGIANLDNLQSETTYTQMTLHGDPMIKLNYHDFPEIELTDSRISFGPENISLATDSIEINIKLRNLGRSITENFNVTIERDFPNSTLDSIYLINVEGLDYEKNLQIKIPLQASIGIGLNKFTIKVDRPDYIEEQYDEVINNQSVKNFLISVDGVEPIWPEDFAVVPTDTIILRASTINPLADIQSYKFEIDSTRDFSSPFKKFVLQNSLGGVLSAEPSDWVNSSTLVQESLILEDSVVYFWRVVLVDNDMNWKTRSFQYIKNKRGWGQDAFGQFTSNSFIGISLNQSNQFREFEPIQSQISCFVTSSLLSYIHPNNAWSLNGIQQDYDICTTIPKFHVAVIDKASLTPMETRYTYSNGTVVNPNNDFGNSNDNGGCAGRPMRFFTFHQNNPTEIDAFQNFVENEISNGDYILIYSPIKARYDWWSTYDPGLFDTFTNLGSDSISPSRPNQPFIFLTRKGDPSFVVEVFSQNGEDITMDTIISGSETIGFESSPLIGPVSNWGELHWKQNPLEGTSSDSTSLKIQLFDDAGIYISSIDTLFTLHDSIIDLSLLVSADTCPYMKLAATYSDINTQTPAQMDFWHVLYTPIPEAAIDASMGYTWLPNMDSLQEGQEGSFAVDIVNISDVNMDSLLVEYYIVDENQQIHPLSYPRSDSLLINGVLRDTISFDTKGLIGTNYFCVDVNPYIDLSLNLTDQPEQTHINNILQIPFSVSAENINPILDVTFNGIHILNNDIVAPTNEILITLNDENPYLILDSDSDTSLFGIYITDPDGIQSRVPFVDGTGNTVMQWIPGDENQNKFKIIYPAYFEKSGVYSILVQGEDKSGNLSGDFDYKVDFEVIHESMITQLMNYPNPFSTSTRFVFTLTGDRIPDDVLIQIMTISGRVVREINESELGPIQIGRNISEFAWDGRDHFGDQLANGVYLYRVKAKIDGVDINLLESGADKYFHKGLGKMYLLR